MTGIEKTVRAVSDLYDFYMTTRGLREALKDADDPGTRDQEAEPPRTHGHPANWGPGDVRTTGRER